MTRHWSRVARLTSAAALLLAAAQPSHAACGNDGTGFSSWLQTFKGRAAAAGIRQGAIERGLAGLTYDANVVRLDRSQRSFKLSFEQFYARRVSPSLLARGRQNMKTHAVLLSRIERQYGVPPSVIVSIWGLETNYGSDGSGRHSILRSIATLAYDCRRSAFFENELINALRIIDRGDMSPAEMRGGWAGEIGPMQFLPSSYVKYAVDFDANGRKDLMRNLADMLGSTGNYLKQKGWRAGQPWGPGTHNFNVIREWNKAEVYVRTIAAMSQRLASGD
jgi:lytic murein transglycosylase